MEEFKETEDEATTTNQENDNKLSNNQEHFYENKKSLTSTKKKNKKISPWLFMCLAGIFLFIIGLTIQIPSTKLTYYNNLDGYYTIEEYVGGDAYNYIIGASLDAGEISAKTTQKTIYICSGIFMFFFGLGFYSFSKNIENKNFKEHN